jgi:hypothetical protein
MMDKVIKDSTGAMVNLDAEEARVNELLGAFNEAILKRLPLHGGTLFHAAINLLREVIEPEPDGQIGGRISCAAGSNQYVARGASEVERDFDKTNYRTPPSKLKTLGKALKEPAS